MEHAGEIIIIIIKKEEKKKELSLIATDISKTLDSEFGSYDPFLSDNIKINVGQEPAYRRYFSCVRVSCIVVLLWFIETRRHYVE